MYGRFLVTLTEPGVIRFHDPLTLHERGKVALGVPLPGRSLFFIGSRLPVTKHGGAGDEDSGQLVTIELP